MRDSDFHLQCQYVHQIADQLACLGARLPPWFQALQRPGAAGELEWPALSFDQFRQLVDDAIALTGETAFGLLVGDRLRLRSHGVLGYAAASSSSLRQLLELLQQFVPVRTSLLGVRFEADANVARLVFFEPRPLHSVRLPVLEAVVLTLKNVIDYAFPGASPVHRVAISLAAPPHADRAAAFFKCPVRYGESWSGIEIPAALLDRPSSAGDPKAFFEAVERCRQELALRARQQSLAARVQSLLLEDPHRFPSLQQAASRLNMTARTLHRRLTGEGTSFSALLEERRHRLALEHLEAGRLSLQEIAFRLGYTDLSNFRRAFRRWEGVTPSAYRGSAQ